MNRLQALCRVALFALAVVGAASPAAAQEGPSRPNALAAAKPGDVRLFVSGALRAPVQAVQADAQAAVKAPLVLQVSESRVLQQAIEAGQPFEVALLTRPVIDDMIAKGFIRPGSQVDLANVPLGVAIRGDVTGLAVDTPEALKKTLLGAKAVRRFYGLGASAPGVDKVFDELGVGDALHARIVPLGTGRPAADVALGPGEYELIINLASEVIPMRGWRYLGVVPQQFQLPVLLAAGIGAKGDPDKAKALVGYLQGATFQAALKANGMIPQGAGK